VATLLAYLNGPEAHLLIDHVPVAGAPFAARLQFWSRPDPECLVTLRRPGQSGDDAIVVAARELSGADLLALLEQLVVINDRGDLLDRYQAEYDRRRPFRGPH